jgi:serine protease Do
MHKSMKNILSLITIAVVSSGMTVGIYEFVLRKAPATPQVREVIYKDSNPNAYHASNPNRRPSKLGAIGDGTMQSSFADASAIARASVVHIQSGKTGKSSDLFGGASGSGVILSEDGYIITNNHVIEGSKEVKVTLNNRQSYTARVIGTDPSTDLAVVKIKDGTLKGRKLAVAKWANSDDVLIGEWVLAVGNPFNLTSTVTAGIVSAKGRNIDILEGIYSVESFIQTDAAVNPGNSGGALVDANTGDLVGINTAIITRSGRYEGYSFAVPANLAKKVMTDIIEFGEVKRGFLGVTIKDVDESIATKNDLADLDGVYLDGVNSGSAAEEGGLKKGDIITKVNNIAVGSSPELQEQVALFRPDAQVMVEYKRGGKIYETSIKLKGQNNASNLLAKTKTKRFKNKSAMLEDLGVEAADLSGEDKKRLKVDGGIRITRLLENGLFASINMEVNFIVLTVNGKKVKSIEELSTAIFEAAGEVTIDGFYEEYEGQYSYVFNKD